MCDTAGPGVDPAIEVTRRQLQHEIHNLRGECTVQLLWDIEAFYDSVPLGSLVRTARQQGMPEEAAILALQMHTAARTLRLPGSLSEPIASMGRSLLAGAPRTRVLRAATS